jgi:hypothetical protein
VTHYFFDDCAYYTPMRSDPIRGLVAFRHPVDVSLDIVMMNRPNGAAVPDDFMTLSEAWLNDFDIEQHAFDSAAYLAANPDVAAAGVDPWMHWRDHGRYERRQLRPQ